MHNHIGCICWTFLHCVFLKVSSNHLPEKMHSYTGCICWSFLHCVFSKVSSSCLPERMHSYTGYTCLTFSHCALTHVSSYCLVDMMQNHTACTCLTFLPVCFEMSPQSACLKECVIALVALFYFSPRCIFRCLPKSLAWDNANLHCLHLWDFSPLCAFIWILKHKF